MRKRPERGQWALRASGGGMEMTKLLDRFSVDLTEKAAQGKCGVLTGRETELRRITESVKSAVLTDNDGIVFPPLILL